MSFFVTQGIISIYEYLGYTDYDCSSNLKEDCQHINDITQYSVYEIDDKYDSFPWEKNDITKMCPFMAVWNTFGLSNMQIF